jgi:hypothetical protein
MFEEKYGTNAPGQIADRTQQALEGIPMTLAAIKRIASRFKQLRGPSPGRIDL